VLVLASFLWILLAVTLTVGGAQFAQWLLPGSGPRAVLAAAAAAGVPLVLVLGPATAGLFRFARNACAAAEPDLLDLLWGFRSVRRTAVLLALSQFVTAGVLLADLLFFLSFGSPAGAAGAALFGYLLLFWGLALLYQWPLLAELEAGPRSILKKSALLVLGNPGPSLATGALALSFTILAWGIVLPALLLWAGVLAFLQTRVLRLLLQRYAILPPDPVPEPADESWGHGWHE
jgi:uncharacterized membrane protein YesL